MENNIHIIKKDVAIFEVNYHSDCNIKKDIKIVGCGWGTIGFIKHIDTNKYNVTIIYLKKPYNHLK